MLSSHTPPVRCHWFSRLASALDRRSATRLGLLFVGVVRARGRRTVTRGIRAAGLSAQFRRCYATRAAVGRRTDAVAARLVRAVIAPVVADQDRLTLALDDTPTERSGPTVQGAGVHHNPTPGPAGAAFVYGHVWVVLGVLATHPTWGVLALPVVARMYIRATNLGAVPAADRPAFRTKHALGVELIQWAAVWLKMLGKPLWVVADGAYATAPFRKPVIGLGVTVVSRLRSDAALWTEPGPRRPGPRGRARKYGDRRIDLTKRAGQKRGWSTGTFTLYGKVATKRYKTFVATWRPAGGAIRVVLVDDPTGWRAYFGTDPGGHGRRHLDPGGRAVQPGDRVPGREANRRGGGPAGPVVADEHRGVPRVPVGVRDDRGVGVGKAVGRARRPPGRGPWDDPDRRPSHADKRRAWQRELLGNEIRAALPAGMKEGDIRGVTERLLDLAA